MRLWRICRERHALTAFSGDGARLVSGRWHTEGTPMVYTAESLSLAVLEIFVHLSAGQRPEDLVSILAEVPVDAAQWERGKREILAELPEGWKRSHAVTRAVGDAWVARGKALVLPVPSVIADGEWNALINPEHPEAKRIEVLEVKPFRFDPRMFK